MTDQTGNKVPETGRERAKRKESGSQTEDNERCGSCRNMADTITEMNRKLDLVLARMEEIDEIKEFGEFGIRLTNNLQVNIFFFILITCLFNIILIV